MKFRVFATQEEIEAPTAHEAAREYWRRLHQEGGTDGTGPLIVAEEDTAESFTFDDVHEFERSQVL